MRGVKLKPMQQLKLAAFRVLALLPVRPLSALGAFLGARHAKRGIAHKRAWIERLHRNFEHHAAVADRQLREEKIVDFIGNVGSVYIEFLVLQKMAAKGHAVMVGEENLAGIERPVIIVSCHLGNWELVGLAVQKLGRPLCDIYAPPADPVRQVLAQEARLRWKWPLELVDGAASNALRRVDRAAARGDNVLLFIDEEKDGYVSAPSLGRDIPYAGNRWYAARLAVKHGMAILPVYVERVGAADYRVNVEPLIEVPREGEPRAQAQMLADALDARLNAWIKPRLEQWMNFAYFDAAKKRPQG
ncbi:MAG: hypothetical protein B7Y40_06385 [Gammaproteobacteria bacterium 28-57-27]|nr:MAG: hypothetical protein B7Y40_06385 [Gammaproteobacteria bacterium 28-57-27]